MQTDPLAHIATRILNHHKFDDVVLHYVEGLQAWRRNLGALNKIISSHARAHILGCCIYLHFNNETGDTDHGATFERLASLCLNRIGCGPKVLRTVLVIASVAGYLKVERGLRDRRLKLYRPTEKLAQHFRALYDLKLGCFDMLLEGHVRGWRPSQGPEAFRRLTLTAGAAYFEERVPILEYFDSLYPILCVDGGFGTVISVVEAQLREQPPPSLSQIGQQFRFSASQARKILKLAEGHGLLAFSADGRVADAGALVDIYKRFLAREFALYSKYSLGLESHFVTSKAA